MTGAVAAAVMGVTSAGGGSGATPGAMAWANIYGLGEGTNAPLAFSGIGAGLGAAITAAASGTASLFFILNGVSQSYTGAFTVHDGDKLAWGVIAGAGTTSGTVTVSSGGTTIGSFTYFLRQPGGGGYL